MRQRRMGLSSPSRAGTKRQQTWPPTCQNIPPPLSNDQLILEDSCSFKESSPFSPSLYFAALVTSVIVARNTITSHNRQSLSVSTRYVLDIGFSQGSFSYLYFYTIAACRCRIGAASCRAETKSLFSLAHFFFRL